MRTSSQPQLRVSGILHDRLSCECALSFCDLLQSRPTSLGLTPAYTIKSVPVYSLGVVSDLLSSLPSEVILPQILLRSDGGPSSLARSHSFHFEGY